MSAKSRVALYQGEERTSNLRHTLELVMGSLPWSSYRHVVVKPNLVVYDRPYAITHRDALETVLALIREYYTGSLTIAEGCAVQSTADAFAAHDYAALADRYRCRLVDLNADETIAMPVYDRTGQRLALRLARTISESDCRISLALPKTHDTVLATLSIKNMIMASLVNRRLTTHLPRPRWYDRIGQILWGHGNGWGSDKVAMHQSYPIMNVNLARIAPWVWPQLSILDGFVAMEGAGPIDGTPVSWGIALASTDPLAIDTLAASLMGFTLPEIGYLHYCRQLGLGNADLDNIEVVGNVTPAAVARRFVPHPQHQQQRQWHHPQAAKLLELIKAA